MNTRKTHYFRIINSMIGRGKVFLFLASIFFLLPMISYGAEVTLAWDANTESDLAGYKIYFGTASGVYSDSVDVGNITQYTLTDLDDDTRYYLAATAYDGDDNESGYSEELVHVTDALNHNPGTPSVPSSSSSGFTETNYSFSTTASDPDGDPLEYRYDWGDGSISGWGASSQSHAWATAGIFCVKARAKDNDGALSGWSNCKSISITENTHTIKASAGTNGSISPSGNVTINDGSSQTFNISADATYHIQNVLVDGVSVGAVASYTFSNVTQNHTIAVSFYVDNQPPIADAGPNQTVNEGIVVALKGDNSLDPDGSIAAYSWSQISGAPIHLSNSGQIEANFTTPNVIPSGETLIFQLSVTDNEGLQDIDTCSVYVTREDVTDSDGDGVPDEQDDFPYDQDEYLDTDGDGEGNNADTDDDNDGMPDTWELLYGLDPLKDDAADDPDGDDLSNINEYDMGSEPNYNENNLAPDSPQLLSPGNYEIVGLTPLLETNEFYDPNVNDTHSQTQWQIIRLYDTFCVFDVTTSTSLTELNVPKLILEEDTEYSWQVRYIDNQGTTSTWSEAGYFTTEFIEQDADGNGVLDDQEVDSTLDLDNNGIMDRDQEDIKCVTTEIGNFKIGISIKDDENIDSIISVESETVDETDLSLADHNGPTFLAFGLIHFSLLVNEPGDEVLVTIYLSEPAYEDGVWYKYDPVNDEWFDYSDFIDFSADRKMVHLTLTDGGFGDADGIENGVIVDPLALRTVTDHSSGSEDFVEDITGRVDPSGVCFISAVASWSADKSSPNLGRDITGRELSIVFILLMCAYIGKEVFLKVKQNRRPWRKTSLMEGWRNSES